MAKLWRSHLPMSHGRFVGHHQGHTIASWHIMSDPQHPYLINLSAQILCSELQRSEYMLYICVIMCTWCHTWRLHEVVKRFRCKRFRSKSNCFGVIFPRVTYGWCNKEDQEGCQMGPCCILIPGSNFDLLRWWMVNNLFAKFRRTRLGWRISEQLWAHGSKHWAPQLLRKNPHVSILTKPSCMGFRDIFLRGCHLILSHIDKPPCFLLIIKLAQMSFSFWFWDLWSQKELRRWLLKRKDGVFWGHGCDGRLNHTRIPETLGCAQYQEIKGIWKLQTKMVSSHALPCHLTCDFGIAQKDIKR